MGTSQTNAEEICMHLELQMHKNQDQPDCQQQINILIIHESSRSRKQIARKTQIIQLYLFSGHLQYTNPSSYLSMKNQHQLEIQGTANLPLPRNQNPMRTKNGKNNIFAQKKKKTYVHIYPRITYHCSKNKDSSKGSSHRA